MVRGRRDAVRSSAEKGWTEKERAEKERGDTTVGLWRRGHGMRSDTARSGGETTCVGGVDGPREGVRGPSSVGEDCEEP